MHTRSAHRQKRLASMLLAGAVILAACGGSSDGSSPTTDQTETSTPDTTGGDGTTPATDEPDCVTILSRNTPFTGEDWTSSNAYQYINQLCDQLEESEAADLTVNYCSTPDQFPEIFVPDADEQPDRVYFIHDGIIRFHPTDEFVEVDPAAIPSVAHRTDEVGAADDIDIHVIDNGGAHGLFVASIIRAMTGLVPTVHGPKPGRIITESEITAALTAIVPENDDQPDDPELKRIFINMSFGAYLCDDNVPVAFEAELDDFATRARTDVRIVASAGNDETSQRAWPAAFATTHPLSGDDGNGLWEVVAVGSTGADSTKRSCFSNHGPHVSTWWIGEEVLVDGKGNSESPFDKTGTWSGTSFASPQVLSLLAAGEDLSQLGAPANAVEPNPSTTPEHTVTWEDATGAKQEATTFCAPHDSTGPGDYSPQYRDVAYS